MTKLLEEALAKLSELPERDQDTIAAWLLEELASEQRWDQLFCGSLDKLASLADEALAEHRRGRTQELNSDTL